MKESRIFLGSFAIYWEQRKLDDMAKFSKGNGYSKGDLVDNGTPIILYGRLYTKYETTIKKVDTFVMPKNGSVYSKGGEVIVPASGETAEDIARASSVENAGVLLGGDLNIIMPAQNINSTFLALSISNGKPHKELSKKAQGKSVVHIHNAEIRELDIFFPHKCEQDRIAKYFESLDNLITLHQRKYDKLTKVKKSMLDKMFPKNGSNVPEIRFKGFSDTWEQRKFGDCVLIQRGGSPRPIEDYITNDENGVNWIKIGDVAAGSRYITSTKEKIKPEGVKKSRCVEVGDLILSNSMSFGRPYIMQINGCIHDGWLLIRDEKKMFNLEYLLQLLSSDYMFNQYKALAAGGVVNNLNSELVQSTIAMIPSLPEQVVIGKFFSKLDNLITLHQRELEKLKNLKKACLEKMFV